jgi:hypothetical protein
MKRNSLLTAGAALTIAAAAVVGGYFVDRMPTRSVELAEMGPPHSVTVPPPVAMKHTAKPSTVAVVATPAPALQPASPALLRETFADGALVAVSGTITDKKGNVLTLKEASGPVRVVMREDVPRPRDMTRDMTAAVRAMDKMDVGAPVTVYGKLRTNEPGVTKLYADAVYDPATKTLYQLNGDRPAAELTSAAITARYMPVGKAHTAKVTMTKLVER